MQKLLLLPNLKNSGVNKIKHYVILPRTKKRDLGKPTRTDQNPNKTVISFQSRNVFIKLLS